MSTETKHRCEGYKECAYWAEWIVKGPASGESYYVCSNCVRLFKWGEATKIEAGS